MPPTQKKQNRIVNIAFRTCHSNPVLRKEKNGRKRI
jgi:hypothetical protein